MAATVDSRSHIAAKIHWWRIVLGAFLLELVLVVVLIPIGVAFAPAGGAITDSLVFLIAVPIGCFAGGAAVSAWILRKVAARRVLHGALLGGVATLIYFGLAAAAPGGIPAAIAGYGPPLFWVSQVLRIAGTTVGAAYTPRP